MAFTIVYKTTVIAEPENICINNIDEHFYTHHGRRPEEWKNLLELAKSLPTVQQKELLGFELTDKEKLAKELYYGISKPNLSIDSNGNIYPSDGRHRMQAVKEAGIHIPIDVYAYLEIQRVRVNDLYKKQKLLFFEKITKELNDDFTYIVAKTSIDNLHRINRSSYIAIPLTDQEQSEYVLISKPNVIEPEQFRLTLQELEKHNIEIYKTSDRFYDPQK